MTLLSRVINSLGEELSSKLFFLRCLVERYYSQDDKFVGRYNSIVKHLSFAFLQFSRTRRRTDRTTIVPR